MNLTITEACAQQIFHMMKEEGKENSYLRIGVTGGGCSGLSYRMGFEEEKSDNDLLIEEHQIKILVNKDDAPLLDGVKIDYIQNMMGGGFTIDNPNAIATCGCGSSFRTAKNAGTPEEC
ncbi:HesB/IscA family protein [Calidifontibacillus erzurumensis]|uniref:Iron-sulfur cluster assembly accessory protein n=1 Tax=Calidifontibacillus erzurumensis TaxID=2741433 RepID=A0A8J8GDL7_9BACI|nr:iron-sulfur cluster assembly accessory protein [Calidifontibacillus erzurumensis]NSL51722.1 iron-sulfur cluster assembly accessory protein [Calidifontibacillus erzurumensis]